MATVKTRKKNSAAPGLLIRTLSLAPADLQTLDRIAQEASDYTGWTVSGSAIMRGLLRHADQQGRGWIREQLAPLIEDEIQRGTVWGKKK